MGTNAVPSPCRPRAFLAILHGLSTGGPKRYANFWYEFQAEPPWNLTAMADAPMDLPMGTIRSGFIFTSSLTIVSQGLAVGYTVNDRTASFDVISLREACAQLRPLL